MRILVSALLSLLLGSLFGITFTAMLGRAEESIFITSDGTISPSSAPIQRDEERYTLMANLSSGIVVQRDNIVIDGNGYTLQGDGAGKGFDLSYRKNVTVKNAHIRSFTYGVDLEHSTDNKIVGNWITRCVYGIMSQYSPRNTIINNIVTNDAVNENWWDGIFATYSDGSTLNNNTIANFYKWGLYIGSSTGIILRNNQIDGNRWNFAVTDKFIHDIDSSNTVDGKPIYYLVKQQDTQVPANAGYVAIVNSTNITVRNLNLTNNGQGVVLVNSKNCLVENSVITKMGYYAIQIVDADDNTISNNDITDNRPPYFGAGIAVQRYSTGNIIRNNLIKNNELGILFYNSDDNKIYHNNFVGNAVQASSDGSKNTWDNGYPFGGNYWSNHVDSDNKSGSNQDKPGRDGIGDNPYIIDKTNRDEYPFMSMVPKVGSAFVDVTLASTGIATIIAVAILAYFIKTRIRANMHQT